MSPTPKRSIRADSDLWGRVQAKAREQGTDAGDITRGLWEAWLSEDETNEGDDNG